MHKLAKFDFHWCYPAVLHRSLVAREIRINRWQHFCNLREGDSNHCLFLAPVLNLYLFWWWSHISFHRITLKRWTVNTINPNAPRYFTHFLNTLWTISRWMSTMWSRIYMVKQLELSYHKRAIKVDKLFPAIIPLHNHQTYDQHVLPTTSTLAPVLSIRWRQIASPHRLAPRYSARCLAIWWTGGGLVWLWCIDSRRHTLIMAWQKDKVM